MRITLSKSIFFILLVLLVSNWQPVRATIDSYITFFRETDLREGKLNDITDAKASLCYELDKEKWLNFEIPVSSRRIRLITNGLLPSLYLTRERDTFPYSIEYRFLDAMDNEIVSGEYNIISKQTKVIDTSTGHKKLSSFISDSPFDPIDGRIIKLSLDEMAPSGSYYTLRIRLKLLDEPLAGVVLRCYSDEATLDRKRDIIWHRLGKESRENLASYNIFPSDFMSTEQKEQLTHWFWKPRGATGSHNIDYKMLHLYTSVEEDSDNADNEVNQGRLYFDSTLHATIPVGSNASDLEINFYPESPLLPSEAPTINVVWYGKRYGQTKNWSVRKQNNSFVFKESLEPGILELTADIPFTAAPSVWLNGTQSPLIIPPLSARVFQSNSNGFLAYSVLSLPRTRTPVRLDIRVAAIDENGVFPSIAKVELRQFDQAGAKISSTDLKWTPVHSVYDRLLINGEKMAVSRNKRLYFNFSPKTHHIELHSAQDVWITAFNRPADFPRLIRIPGDYDKQNYSQRQRAWFPFQPRGLTQLFNEKRTALVDVQFAAPVWALTDTETPISLWESFYPNDEWAGRYLFEPLSRELVADDKPVSDKIYYEIETGRDIQLDWKKNNLNSSMKPKLIYLQEEAGADEILIKKSNEVIEAFTVNGLLGEIELGDSVFDDSSIQVVSKNNARIYLNNIYRPSEARRLRFCNHLTTNSALEFYYDKSTDDMEKIILRFHVDHSKALPVELRVVVEPDVEREEGPLSSYTFPERHYLIQPGAGEPIPLMETRDQFVSPAQICVIPIDDDFPRGKYKVSIHHISGPSGYIQLSRTLRGDVTKRSRTLIERVADDFNDNSF